MSLFTKKVDGDNPLYSNVNTNTLHRKILIRGSELNLKVCLASGQTFSWVQHGEYWCNYIDGQLLILSEDEENVYFHCTEETEEEVLKSLKHYFRLEEDLSNLYEEWIQRDDIFKNCASLHRGVRLLAQDPFESLISFVCSQNNGINRIASMVRDLKCQYGDLKVIIDDETKIFSFPTPAQINKQCTEAALRKAGFGYRAAYIPAIAKSIIEGDLDLQSISSNRCEYHEAWKKLMSIKGVGPKVADCVALTGLGHMEAVPIDTHIWRIARTKYSGMPVPLSSLTLNHYMAIGDRFRVIHGAKAGWAQLVLFASQIYSKSSTSRKNKK